MDNNNNNNNNKPICNAPDASVTDPEAMFLCSLMQLFCRHISILSYLLTYFNFVLLHYSDRF